MTLKEFTTEFLKTPGITESIIKRFEVYVEIYLYNIVYKDTTKSIDFETYANNVNGDGDDYEDIFKFISKEIYHIKTPDISVNGIYTLLKKATEHVHDIYNTFDIFDIFKEYVDEHLDTNIDKSALNLVNKSDVKSTASVFVQDLQKYISAKTISDFQKFILEGDTGDKVINNLVNVYANMKGTQVFVIKHDEGYQVVFAPFDFNGNRFSGNFYNPTINNVPAIVANIRNRFGDINEYDQVPSKSHYTLDDIDPSFDRTLYAYAIFLNEIKTASEDYNLPPNLSNLLYCNLLGGIPTNPIYGTKIKGNNISVHIILDLPKLKKVHFNRKFIISASKLLDEENYKTFKNIIDGGKLDETDIYRCVVLYGVCRIYMANRTDIEDLYKRCKIPLPYDITRFASMLKNALSDVGVIEDPHAAPDVKTVDNRFNKTLKQMYESLGIKE